jgi:hypothetical protein
MKKILINTVILLFGLLLYPHIVMKAEAQNLSFDEVQEEVRRVLFSDSPKGLCFFDAINASLKLAFSCQFPNSKFKGWRIRGIQTWNPQTGVSEHEAVLLTSPTGSHYYVDSNWRPGFITDVAQMQEIEKETWIPIDNLRDQVTVFSHTFFLLIDYIKIPEIPSQWNMESIYLSSFGDGWPSDRLVFIPGGLLRNFDYTCPSVSSTALNENEEFTCKQPEGSKFFPINTIRSFDPNDKLGSRGVESVQFISGEEPLRYSILFENLETATAPAQEVVITDKLDVDRLDLSTLSLGPIAFGDNLIIPPFGLSSYKTDVDLRPQTNLIIRVEANLNRDTGLLSWHFKSIDPATGELPQDPLIGFLPPNINPPEGDGSVLFTVMPKLELPTGTEIRNQAEIVFDVNAPIVTPEWLNTLDNTKPISQVLPLSQTQDSLDFEVKWSGSDEGPGIKDYTIYVSEDGGAFDKWLINEPSESATFSGKAGRSYAFCSVARDQTGNTEDPPGVPDADTQVIESPLPASPVLVFPANGQSGLGTTVTFRWKKVSDPEGKAITYDLHYCKNSDFSGCSPLINVASLGNQSFFAAAISSYTAGLILFGVVFVGIVRPRKTRLLIVGIIISTALLFSCGGGDNGGISNPTDEISYTVTGLSNNTTYYWKVVANSSNGGSSESETRSFTTQ